MEVVVHCQTKAERDKLHEEGTKKEGIVTALREVGQKKREWYDK